MITVKEKNYHLDKDIVTNAQNGDLEAFRQIVIHYSNALLSVAYSVVGDFHEAQDIAQETFVKCYRKLHTLKDPNRIGSWLYSITYRASLDFIKKKTTNIPLNEAITQKSSHLNDWLDQHIIQDSIWNAIQSLEGKSKSAVVLYYLSDWNIEDIGIFLELSASAVESRIRRAREKLRINLSNDFEDYFRSYKLGVDFEQAVCEQVLRRMGHFYIPVKDKNRTKEWFIQYFHLGITLHGNLQLESGDELYLIECQSYTPSEIPILTFFVSNIEDIRLQLKRNGVKTETIQSNDLFGKIFSFYDPDGNKFNAVEK